MRKCIDALAALYILNVYYKDEIFRHSPSEANGFDQTLGSDLFSVVVNRENSCNGKMKDDSSATYCTNKTREFIAKWSFLYNISRAGG